MPNSQLDVTRHVDTFERLRHTDVLGDHWSARELQAALGYTDWRNFEDAVERASLAITNSGMLAADHVGGATKMIETGKGANRIVTDYRLTKYGAYMVAMNGDPRKAEIAAAQTYFAVRTHQAETQLTAAPTFDPTTMEGAMAIIAAAQTAIARVRELEPVAAHAEAFRQADGLRGIGDLANDFKVHAKTAYPAVKVKHQTVWAHAARLDIVIRGNTVRHNQPTARAIEAGWAKPHRYTYETEHRGTQTSVSTRLTPKGEARLWDGMCAWISDHGTLELLEVAA